MLCSAKDVTYQGTTPDPHSSELLVSFGTRRPGVLEDKTSADEDVGGDMSGAESLTPQVQSQPVPTPPDNKATEICVKSQMHPRS
jgi:hypothetical protein